MSSVNLTTHVSGLASGMDTESIVNNLMKVNRIPLDKLNHAKTINTWKTDAYREINTKIASFRDAMQDLRLQGTFNAQKVTSSNSSVDVSMAGTSTQSNFTITSATLATSDKAASVSFNTAIAKGADKIDTAGTAANDVTFNLNGVPITISKTSSFDEAIATINSSSATTKVKVSNVGGSLVFNSTEAGSSSSVTITNTNTEAQNLLKLSDGTTKVDSTAATTSTPPASLFTGSNVSYSIGVDKQPGSVTINGLTIAISSNTFTYDGVQINLKQDISSDVGISVTSDTDKIFDKIKTFVDKYNELIKDINDKISEKKYRDYPPLTDEQKKDMKDDDIKLWEDKAKSGLLANDSTLRQFLTQVRSSISEVVQGTGVNTSFDSLHEIGVTTSTNYRDQGKLTLDETKLKSILSSNMTDVQNLFALRFDTGSTSDTTLTSSEKYQKSGVAVRIYDKIGDTLSSLKLIAGSPGTISTSSNLYKLATSLDERIAKMNERLNSEEQSLWTKFNAMESALQKMNSQSSWLYQQLGQ